MENSQEGKHVGLTELTWDSTLKSTLKEESQHGRQHLCIAQGRERQVQARGGGSRARGGH